MQASLPQPKAQRRTISATDLARAKKSTSSNRTTMSLREKLDEVERIYQEVSSSVATLLSDPGNDESLENLGAANGRIEALGIDRYHALLIDIGSLQDIATSAAPHRRILERNAGDETAKISLQDVENELKALVRERSYPPAWNDLLQADVQADVQYIIIHNEMDEEKQARAENVAREAIKKKPTNEEIARQIRKRFEARYGRSWHCIVGEQFNWSGHTAPKSLIHFKLGALVIVLYKYGG